MTYRRILIFLSLLTLFAIPLAAQWEKVGWQGGYFDNIYQLGKDLYGSTTGEYGHEIYRSTDDGETWHLFINGLPNTFFSDFHDCFRLGNKLIYEDRSYHNSPFVFQNGYYSIKQGDQEWSFYGVGTEKFKEIAYDMNAHSNDSIFRVSFLQSPGNIVSLSISADSGATWKNVGKPLPDSVLSTPSTVIVLGQRIVFTIQTVDSTGRSFFLTYFTDNLGKSWQRAVTGVPDTLHFAIFQPDNSDLLFANVSDPWISPTESDGFYRSDDSGATWAKINSLPSYLDQSVGFHFVLIDSIIFCGTSASFENGGSFQRLFLASYDSGKTWEKLNDLDSLYNDLIVTNVVKRPRSGDGYIISSSYGFPFSFRVSNDFKILSSLSLEGIATQNGSLLYIDEKKMYASIDEWDPRIDSLYISSDDGTTWYGKKGLPDSVKFSSNWFKTSQGLCAFGKLNSWEPLFLHSNDGGSTWGYELLADTPSSIDKYKVFGDTIMATFPNHNNYFLSEDGGLHWRAIKPSIDVAFSTFAMHHHKLYGAPPRLYSDTSWSKIVFSADLGETWQTYQFLPLHFFDMHNYLSFGDKLFLFGTESQRGTQRDSIHHFLIDSVTPHIFVSTNDGLSWALSGDGIAPNSDPVPAATENDIIYLVDNPIAGGSNQDGRAGVYFSKDTGRTWSKTQGTVPAVADLFIGSEYLFLGRKRGGLYRFPKGLASVRTGESKYETSISITSAYPNPARDEMRIGYSIPKQANVKLTVYDMTGKQMEVLADEAESAGNYEIQWDTRAMASGTYILELSANGEKVTKPLQVLK